jgi:hypothetical protein
VREDLFGWQRNVSAGDLTQVTHDVHLLQHRLKHFAVPQVGKDEPSPRRIRLAPIDVDHLVPALQQFLHEHGPDLPAAARHHHSKRTS